MKLSRCHLSLSRMTKMRGHITTAAGEGPLPQARIHPPSGGSSSNLVASPAGRGRPQPPLPSLREHHEGHEDHEEQISNLHKQSASDGLIAWLLRLEADV